tara:strand:+ start:387 stop:902 length:516 start_codon:yes stop_codon:yes gene_type:complete
MPKGLKANSGMLVIGATATESAVNTLTTTEVSLQLNALDNEVFVVTAVDIDNQIPDPVGGKITSSNAWVTKQDPAGVRPGFEQSNVIATKTIAQDDRLGNGTPVGFETSSMESPATDMDYLNIIATPDFYLNVIGDNTQSTISSSIKLYGYRAKAEAAVYAALVQSEVLSA